MAAGTKIALRLALVTGQRIGEVCGALKSEIDLDKAEWLIPARRVKNRRDHSVPLSPMAVKLFRQASELSGESPFLFPSRPRSRLVLRQQHLASHGVAHAMQGALKELGLETIPATPHDLRRTVASHWQPWASGRTSWRGSSTTPARSARRSPGPSTSGTASLPRSGMRWRLGQRS